MKSKHLDEGGNLNFEEFLEAFPANLVNIPVEEQR